MVELEDTVKLRGIFQLDVFKWNGKEKKLIDHFEEHNLIVDIARTQMAHLIAGDVTNRSMKSISVGTNGNAPTVNDTAITNPYTKDLDGVSYPAVGQARFAWSLTTSEANGKAIMEFGMLTVDTSLFCRRTRTSPINKESDISLEGTWTIIF